MHTGALHTGAPTTHQAEAMHATCYSTPISVALRVVATAGTAAVSPSMQVEACCAQQACQLVCPPTVQRDMQHSQLGSITSIQTM
jgi:hypothetical protein